MYKSLLLFLRVGVFSNLILFFLTLNYVNNDVDPFIMIPTQILLVVSAYRCLFPVNYASKAVILDSIFSSVFITRFVVTVVEIVYIYAFSQVIRIINADQFLIVDIFSWIMVAQVIVSQFFCWGAILIKYERLYFYEELGWFIIFLCNAIASAILFSLDLTSGHYTLLILNLIFGALYLPWQVFHLKSITNRINRDDNIKQQVFDLNSNKVLGELQKSFQERKLSFDQSDWGGVVGMMWMYGYWILIIPVWMFFIILTI